MGNIGSNTLGGGDGGGAWNPGMAQALGYGYGMPTQAAPDYAQMMGQLGGGMRPGAYAGLGYPTSYGYGSAMPMLPGGGGLGGGYGGMMGGYGGGFGGGYGMSPLMNLGSLLGGAYGNMLGGGGMQQANPGIYAAAQQAAAMTPEQREQALGTPGSTLSNAMQQYQGLSPLDQQRIQAQNAWNMASGGYGRGPANAGYWGQVAQNYKALSPEQQQNLDTSQGSYWGNMQQQFGRLSPGQQEQTRGLFG